MKITLSTLAAILALGLPAHAETLSSETLANGTPVKHVSSSIMMLGEAPEVTEAVEAPAVKRVEKDKEVASMSLDDIIGERPAVMNEPGSVEEGKETESAKAPVSKDAVEPVAADASATAANDADKVTVMRPSEPDTEATASIGDKPPVENQGEVKPSEDEPKDVREEMRPAK